MKPSQNSLFKADTYVRPVAESGICHENGRAYTLSGVTPIFILHGARANEHLGFGTGS
jgi:hypothetical protein